MKYPPVTSGRRLRRGFTLIELMIVVVIIGVLATIAVPLYSRLRDRASRATLMSDLRNLATAQEGHFFERHFYTDVPDSLGFRSSSGVVITIVEATPTGWSATAARMGMASSCHIFHGSAAPLVAGGKADHVLCED